MKALTFRPGDIVPQSGIYRVEHDAHRLMHECTLLKDARFPRCRKCSTVRFELLRPVTRWKNPALPFLRHFGRVRRTSSAQDQGCLSENFIHWQGAVYPESRRLV